jgi:hypothetical protein
MVAALAATSANTNGLPSGTLNPTHDIAIHVGGANAGMRLISNTTTNSMDSVVTMNLPANALQAACSIRLCGGGQRRA